MDSVTGVYIKKTEIERSILIHKAIRLAIETSCSDQSNVKYIFEDAILKGSFLQLILPKANKEWSEDILRSALFLCDLGAYVSIDNEDGSNVLRLDISNLKIDSKESEVSNG